ncbi:anthranilate synthase component I family protein [Paenibacillus sp. alder61]|uniref:anthranilate synthase component I family protein n=1 Tax=Paenibacillus sp. alder61 TaxID=2862948 RepID=UPI001CD6C924|nr:anthranilate synthase component I family protein [Paenibacillus sp. alder61]MCA1296581.1 anthranilate synthase component I family protein [Paenibacillus sp. alder61]
MEWVISREQWEAWVKEGAWTLLPCAVKKTVTDGLPADWMRAWEEAQPYSFVLESGKTGRYTFLGLDPVSVIRGKGDRAVATEFASGETSEHKGKPLKLLQRWMAPWRSPMVDGLPKFCGGAVGFLGYDIARSLERLPRLAQDDLGLDDYVWMRFEEIWIWDQAEKAVYAVVHSPVDAEQGMSPGVLYTSARDRAVRMMERWERFCRGVEEGYTSNSPVEAEELAKSDTLPGRKADSMSQEVFEAAVRRVQDYIAAGDVFQVNLSLRQAFEIKSTPEAVYEWLRRINPSPYMGLLRFPDFQLVSASPELLVKLERGRLSTRPIAGTRRRGLTAEEDALMEAELTGSEKERAEHIMLVDLLRNDLGRVAVYGSVRVSELFTIERYSHVMHLVSEVEGVLPADRTAYDAIAAVFPGGTITGAPKVRTMEIIEELEPVTRGPYTGAMGWIDYNGNMELNIIIRTLVVKDGIGYIQAGAGIVIDSVPYREYRECSNKARAVAAAVRQSEITAVHGEGQGMK